MKKTLFGMVAAFALVLGFMTLAPSADAIGTTCVYGSTEPDETCPTVCTCVANDGSTTDGARGTCRTGASIDSSICTDFGQERIGDETALGTDDAEDTVYNVINIILSVLGIIAVILIIYGGLLWMTAAGDDSKIQKAKQVIYAGIIGLLIIMASFAIANFVVRELASSTGTGG